MARRLKGAFAFRGSRPIEEDTTPLPEEEEDPRPLAERIVPARRGVVVKGVLAPKVHRRRNKGSFFISDIEFAFIAEHITDKGYNKGDFYRRAVFHALGCERPLSDPENWDDAE